MCMQLAQFPMTVNHVRDTRPKFPLQVPSWYRKLECRCWALPAVSAPKQDELLAARQSWQTYAQPQPRDGGL